MRPLYLSLIALIALTAGCKEKVEANPSPTPKPSLTPVVVVKPTPSPTPIKVEEPLFALPLNPGIAPVTLDFIWQEETGGYAYYQKRTKYLEWPKGFSGITGAGFYDAGYHSKKIILLDWSKLKIDWLNRFADTAGITGTKARDLIPELKDITIEWDYAKQVFNLVFIPQFYELSQETFPGFDDLDPVAKGVLVAIVENRGNSMRGPSRVEMRTIKEMVPKKDYVGMANEIVKMKRLWMGTGQNGLLIRRDKEAALMRTCIKK